MVHCPLSGDKSEGSGEENVERSTFRGSIKPKCHNERQLFNSTYLRQSRALRATTVVFTDERHEISGSLLVKANAVQSRS